MKVTELTRELLKQRRELKGEEIMCFGGKSKSQPAPAAPPPSPAPSQLQAMPDTSNDGQRKAAIISSSAKDQASTFGSDLGAGSPAGVNATTGGGQ